MIKKVLSIIIFVLVISLIIVKASNYPQGDVNGDGEVGSSDYILLRKHLLKTSTLKGDFLARADVNNDGLVTSADYIEIRKKIINKDKTDIMPTSTVTETQKPTAVPPATSTVTNTQKPATTTTAKATATSKPPTTATTKATSKPTTTTTVNTNTTTKPSTTIPTPLKPTFTAKPTSTHRVTSTPTQRPTATPSPSPTIAPLGHITFDGGMCDGTLSVILERSVKLADKPYSWDNGNTWIADSTYTVTASGTYNVQIKDSKKNIVGTLSYDVNISVPSSIKNGEINNNEFNIKTGKVNKKVAGQNVVNINRALQCAHNNGVTSLKMQKATYYFDVDSKNTILFNFSNMSFDLNGSTLNVYPNSERTYQLFKLGIYSADYSNIVLKNGTIIGDRYSHICPDNQVWAEVTTGNKGCKCYDASTDKYDAHEHGHAILLLSYETTIENLKISNMAGDAMSIQSRDDNTYKKPIKVINNEIFNCRRNGISIISGQNIQITNNKIYNIYGTNPQSGIDIEPNPSTPSQTYSKILIKNNTIYKTGSGRSVLIHPDRLTNSGENGLVVESNKVSDQIVINGTSNEIIIRNNTLYTPDGVRNCVSSINEGPKKSPCDTIVTCD